MSTVFIGGSRHVSRLPAQVKERLNNVIKNGHQVVVGDANGADKAVQKHLSDARYDKVTVYCSGERPRNNIGHWRMRHVSPPNSAKGFQFYAAKDREMAREADFGLMIWDGKSPGTTLNVLRLIKEGKMATLVNLANDSTNQFNNFDEWSEFLSHIDPSLRAALKERATPDEWAVEAGPQPSLLDLMGPSSPVADAWRLARLEADDREVDDRGDTHRGGSEVKARGRTSAGRNPPHPGEIVRHEILEPFGLGVSRAAEVLGVGRPALSALLNGRAALSPEMALRIEKAFGPRMDHLLRMQLAWDIARIRARESEIDVEPFVAA